MTATVLRLVPNEVGDGYRFEADESLEAAKGYKFTNLVIIGEIEDEEDLYIGGMASAGESMILIERAKMDIIGR